MGVVVAFCSLALTTGCADSRSEMLDNFRRFVLFLCLLVGIDDMHCADDLPYAADASFESFLYVCLVVGFDDEHCAGHDTDG